MVAWEAGGALVAFGGYDGRRERSAVAVMRVEESGAEATKGRGEGAQAAAAVVPGLRCKTCRLCQLSRHD